jgi:ribosomal protein S18 acetylase RimI-like enzyme
LSVEIRSAAEMSRAERAELFTAAYEGYAIPFRVDEPNLAFIEETFDIDLDASRLAFSRGEPIGLGNLGVREEDAWIGGLGVVPAARRSRVGESLMRALHDEARQRGIHRVWLEVIVENTGARTLYEKLGYGTVRDVQVWSLTAAEDGADAALEIQAAEAHDRIRELRSTREPWQRDDASLAKYGDLRGLATADGAAVFRGSGPIQLLQIAGDAEPLLRTLQCLDAVSVLNLPVDDPASAVLRELGGSVRVRQHEMLLELHH